MRSGISWIGLMKIIPEKSRIDLWEWNDKEGNIWFRIDDQGTGMTLGMLQRYFLKVGNSYYNSRELERDLRDHGRDKNYNGISRFGIGFLSSFLCGDYAEVSTLYFDTDKNRREEAMVESYQTIHYGLRLQVTGLSGYYTLKNQAKHHQADGGLPVPGGLSTDVLSKVEREGYRATPGTSIVVRLIPGKLGALNLREAAEKYLCGARVPVYYNNERIGRTYGEIMAEAHKAEGEKLYEMSSTMKEQFDSCFPAVCGQYPKLSVSVIPLDTEENQILPELSGVLWKYDVRFEQIPQWKVKDQTYEVYGRFEFRGMEGRIKVCSKNKSVDNRFNDKWEDLKNNFDSEKVAALEEEFAKHIVCPKAKDIEEIWEPFSEKMHLYKAWRIYHDSQQEAEVNIPIAEMECPDIVQICRGYGRMVCAYQGIVAGALARYPLDVNYVAVFLMEGAWKPVVDISRSKVSGLPLMALLAINGILSRYQMLDSSLMRLDWRNLEGWRNSTLKEWKKIKDSQLDRWLRKNQEVLFRETMGKLQKPLYESKDDFSLYGYSKYVVLYKYLMAWFQEKYRLIINYEAGQMIYFCEKEGNETDEIFDLFPPMMFCVAASDQSSQYICSAHQFDRRGITADHPFIIWLLKNAAQLNRYYQRQFQQIVSCLCESSAENIVGECNRIREQFIAFPEHHGVDVSSFPQLCLDDFWSPEGSRK